jgi:hypothetical protein
MTSGSAKACARSISLMAISSSYCLKSEFFILAHQYSRQAAARHLHERWTKNELPFEAIE